MWFIEREGDKSMNVTVFIGASLGGDQMYEFEAKALGKWIGENGHKLVYGGSKIGLMGVLADSVLEHGGEVIGVETAFFLEQKMQHDNLTELIVTESMAERREKMIELGDAFIAFPGGTGTLEEISDVISQKKQGRTEKPAAILNIEGFYDPLKAMLKKMVEEGFLNERDLRKVVFSKNVESAAWHLEHSVKSARVPDRR